MERLIETAKDIGRFELGINELQAVWSGRPRQGHNIMDLMARYSLLIGELAAIATSNERSALATLELLVGSEAAKIGCHYLAKGFNYLNGIIIDYQIKQEENSRPTTLNLH